MRTGDFYEINVSKEKDVEPAGGQDESVGKEFTKERHVFATDSNIRQYDEAQVLQKLKLFAEKFPKSEGYVVSLTFWRVSCPSVPEAISVFVKENWGR